MKIFLIIFALASLTLNSGYVFMTFYYKSDLKKVAKQVFTICSAFNIVFCFLTICFQPVFSFENRGLVITSEIINVEYFIGKLLMGFYLSLFFTLPMLHTSQSLLTYYQNKLNQRNKNYLKQFICSVSGVIIFFGIIILFSTDNSENDGLYWKLPSFVHINFFEIITVATLVFLGFFIWGNYSLYKEVTNIAEILANEQTTNLYHKTLKRNFIQAAVTIFMLYLPALYFSFFFVGLLNNAYDSQVIQLLPFLNMIIEKSNAIYGAYRHIPGPN
ncbi:unnamed protein product [Caenorhabditis angaria]|uniref:Uncharacterized protein n=1 Tax=Caenorhabditis angaria TaxID=860376 RepID=A0A9P1J410_9PELO|nr:unnamed protein product [Caenorhabditis angaria]